MIRKIQFLLGVLMLLSMSSCRLFYPSEMFRQKDYQFFELAKKKVEEYVIEPGDELTLEVYSRDGFKLVDVLSSGTGTTTSGSGASSSQVSASGSSGASGGSGSSGRHTYMVDKEGFVRLPVLGVLYVKGYTQNELETQLAQRFSFLFVNPFVILRVANRRVFLFRGDQGSVVELNNSPTLLPEVLAKAGGLNLNLKAYKIKIIRGDLANPEVRIINMSTLEGIRTADLTVQSNDIIYIEQRRSYVVDGLAYITPILSILSSTLALILVVKDVK